MAPGQLLIAGALIAVSLGWYSYRNGVDGTIQLLRHLPSETKRRLVSAFMGPDGIAVTRIALAAIAVLASIAGMGLLWVLTSGVDASSSSAPLLELVLALSSSGWAYVFVALWFARGSIFFLRKTLIRRAADITGYSRRTVARLAEEARRPTDATRIIAFSDDDEDGLAQRLKYGFLGRDERIRAVTDDSEAAAEDAAEDSPQYSVELVPKTVDEAPPAWFDGLAGVDLDDDEQPEHKPVLEERRVVEDPSEESEDDDDAAAGLLSGDLGVDDLFRSDIAREWPHENDDDELSPAERLKLFRMDWATTLDFDALAWRFITPTLVVFIALVLMSGLWVWWPVYVLFGSLSVAVGGSVYLGTKWWQSRRLETLRQDRSGDAWTQVSVLVKRVETDELTMYYAFMAGRTYASTDVDELSRTVAKRALQRANGEQPAPAIEERWAWCLKRYHVNLEAWRQNTEKPAIMNKLVDEVFAAPKQMLAKTELAYRVIEHDRKYKWRGLRYVGFGYDPCLVAEAYQDLVPEALVETTTTVTGPDGEQRDVTVVRPRTQPLPEDTVELEASFEARFADRGWGSRYELPATTTEERAPRFIAPQTAAATPSVDDVVDAATTTAER